MHPVGLTSSICLVAQKFVKSWFKTWAAEVNPLSVILDGGYKYTEHILIIW